MERTLRHERLGQLLLEAGLITEEQRQQALARQQACGERIGSILVGMGAVSEAVLLQFLSQHYGVAIADLSQFDPTLLPLIPRETAHKKFVVPFRRMGSRLALAVVDPSDVALFDELQFHTGLHIVPHVALESRIRAILHQWTDCPDRETLSIRQRDSTFDESAHRGLPRLEERSHEEWGMSDQESVESAELKQLQVWMRQAMASLTPDDEVGSGYEVVEDDAAPVVNLVHGLLRQAVTMGASDIHVEPLDSCVRVRFRLDGVLRTVLHLPSRLRHSILARLKIMASLDIAERRLPQDGRIHVTLEAREGFDIRVSILPCLYGEKAVLRLLDRSRLSLDLRQLGFEPHDLNTVLTALNHPHGMMLVTGPTGSGKTTTLYSALHCLNTPHVNIVTVEDPVEYHLHGVTQLQIKEDIGLTFAVGLKSLLRQDPDIIMVGEIRDRATADIAVQAALTGHRVLSTLHTSDAPGTIARLLDMGIEPFLVASSVSVIIAQRLVRKICRHCREPDPIPQTRLISLGCPPEQAASVTPARGRGCPHCHGTGFKGRLAIFEVLPMSDALHDHILGRASAKALRTCASAAGMASLRQNGWRKVASGFTTVGEVLAVTAA
ncbi:MAG: type II secretion system protein GspE [Nitrospirae bacterium]|nr:MAG: type II secretion system protein GspE [Nitrospirota bacterium]